MSKYYKILLHVSYIMATLSCAIELVAYNSKPVINLGRLNGNSGKLRITEPEPTIVLQSDSVHQWYFPGFNVAFDSLIDSTTCKPVYRITRGSKSVCKVVTHKQYRDCLNYLTECLDSSISFQHRVDSLMQHIEHATDGENDHQGDSL